MDYYARIRTKGMEMANTLKKSEIKEQTLKIKYDGENQKDNEMDIFDVATSMQGLGELIKEANTLLNPDKKVEIKVDAKFNTGCFEYCSDLIQYGKDVLPYIGIGAASIAITGATFFEVLRKLKGTKIELIEPAEDQEGFFDVTVKGEKIRISDDVRKLLYSKLIRKAVTKIFVDPLSKEGTDKLTITNGDEVVIPMVTKSDLNFYRSPNSDLQVVKPQIDDIPAKVKFVTAHLLKKTDWRIEYAGSPFTVSIEDELFMERMSMLEEPYVLGKTFEVMLEEKIKLDPIKGQIVTYKIKKVIRPVADDK